MIVEDAYGLLMLHHQIQKLATKIEATLVDSEMGQTFQTIPGYGAICSAELAGEIGTLDRFANEKSLALKMGVLGRERYKHQI